MEARWVRGWNQEQDKEQQKTEQEIAALWHMASHYLVCDYCHSRIIEVQPGWDLSIGDNENVPNPWCVPLDRSQWVPQLFVIFKTAGRNVFILLRLRKAWGTERCKMRLSHTCPSQLSLPHSGSASKLPKTVSSFYTLQKRQNTQHI